MTAFLSIWNAIEHPRFRQEYETWHAFHQVPAVVGIPGIVEARRYRSYGNVRTRYFTLYQLASPGVLCSDPYRLLKAQPSEWSSRMSERITDEDAIVCDSGSRCGPSSAVHLSTLRLVAADDGFPAFLADLLRDEVRQAELVSAQWGTILPSALFIGEGHSAGTPAVMDPNTRRHVVLLDAVSQVQLRRRTQRLLKQVDAAGAYLLARPEYFELQTCLRPLSAEELSFTQQLAYPEVLKRYRTQEQRNEERMGSIVLY